MTVRIGLLISGWHDVDEPAVPQLDENIERARVASAEGFDSVWVGEHFLARPWPVFQPALVLARLSGEVSVPQVGMVNVLPFRHPVSYAEELATLDTLLDGRLAVCLTLGWAPAEFAAFGVPRQERVSRFTEYLDVVDRLLTSQEAVHYSGRHVTLDGVTMLARPVRRPRPPFYVGGGAIPAVRRAARLGYAWLGSLHTPSAMLAEGIDAYRTERITLGRGTEAALFRHCYVAATRDQAIEEAGPALLSYYDNLGRRGLFTEVLTKYDLVKSVEEAGRGRAIIGSVDDCVTELRRYRDMGFTELVVQIGLIGIPQHRVLDAIRRFARDVMPQVAEG